MKSMTPRHFKLGELYQKQMFDKLEINESMLVENIVAQMLKASGNELFFYFNADKEDADSRMQIGFLIQKKSSHQDVESKDGLVGLYPEITYLCE